jgi:PAS domain S-box-containing protein
MAKILIVDDNASVRLALQTNLPYLGYDVVGAAANAVEAFDFARLLKPDLVLMDIVMPGELDGIDAAKKIRAELDIPVIFLSGFSDDRFIDRAKCAEPFGYLVKPYSEDELKAAIEVALHKKAQESKLLDSVSQYRTMTEAIPHIFWLATGDYSRMLYVSSSYEQRWGRSCEELYRNPLDFLESVHPDDRRSVLESLEQQKSGNVTEKLYRIISPEGAIRWIRDCAFPIKGNDGTVSRIAGITEDITEHRQAEEALRAGEARYRQIVETAAEGIWLVDAEWKTTFVNMRMEKMLGCEPDEMLGQHVTEFMDEEGRRLARDLRGWRNQGVREIHEFKLLRQDGKHLWVSVATNPIMDESGQFAGALGMVTDITERKREAEEKAKLEAHLRQAQKLEAIGTLAGGIAHDFNNILAAILGYAEMALEDIPEGSPARHDLNQILRATHRATDLVKQILAVSRHRDMQERQPVEIGIIIREALKLLRATLPTTIELRQDIPKKTGTILGDPTQLHQVVVNLCTNAAHAMREHGGILEVRLANGELDADDGGFSKVLAQGAFVRLTVSDTGHGMDAATLERIFDPYFTTKTVGEGSGLGLAVVQAIVKRHEGEIAVRSEPGKGTVFDISFPRTDSGHERTSPELEPIPRGSERVLFIDDEEVLVGLGEKMLRQLGYTVTVRQSSLEAITLFRAQPEAFDLVITDYTMPQMTGAELASEILRVRPDIPIILCTGYSEMITEGEAKKRGIRAFVMKPLSRRSLAEVIRKVLD